MELLKAFKEVEEVVNKNHTILKDDAENLKDELSLGKLEDLEKQIADLENASKKLTIGIVGRVKAGKSSLLNALLFEGKSILPKAATPMTAALTLLSYDEKISAEVEFYTKEDIMEIKQKHDDYIRKFNELKEKYIQQLKKDDNYKQMEKLLKQVKKLGGGDSQSKELEKKAEDLANREISEKYMHLQAAYEHYKDMEKKGLNQNLGENAVITANSVEELSKKLLDYVGSQGKYTPYTKSVRIKAPLESLKGIEIVDTPGINDPVVSREARTRELLKDADVVFVVSNAGQFLSEEDLDLMDRITMKEGIRELFLVVSQVDLQLHGDEKIKAKGNLYTALENIKKKLSDYTQRTLRDLKQKSPEVGDTYDQLIEKTEDRMFLTSGACYSLYKHFNNKQLWDDNMKTVWKNLTNNYPDFFPENNPESALENLKVLSGIDAILEALEEVKERKQEILKKRSEEILRAKSQSLRKYIDGLAKAVEDRLTAIQSTDIKELEKRMQELQKKISNAEPTIENEYDELVEKLVDNIKNAKRDIIRDINNATNKLIRYDQVETESYTVTVEEKRRGFFGFFGNLFFGPKKREETRYVSVLRTGHIEAELNKFVGNLKITAEEKLDKTVKDWRNEFRRKFTNAIREAIGDDLLDIGMLTKSIKTIERSNFNFPSLNDITIPSYLRNKGTLRGDSEIDRYFSDIKYFLGSLESSFEKNLEEFSKNVEKILTGNGSKFIESLFNKYRSEIENLKKDIENQQFMIDRLNNILKELKGLKRKVLLEVG